jgi:hypothetical protein
MQVANTRPAYWLEHTARSEPGRPRWGAPLPGSEDEEMASSPAPEPTAEELQGSFDALLAAGVIDPPACADADRRARCTRTETPVRPDASQDARVRDRILDVRRVPASCSAS